MSISKRLDELNITLPASPTPIGSYTPGIRVGSLILVSGQLPFVEGKLRATGKVGRDLTLAQAQAAARQAGLNALAIAAWIAGDVNHLTRIVRLGVFVNSAPGFFDQPKVANGASDLMTEIFGEAGRHARIAVGVSELPMNAPVEVEMTAEFDVKPRH